MLWSMSIMANPPHHLVSPGTSCNRMGSPQARPASGANLHLHASHPFLSSLQPPLSPVDFLMCFFTNFYRAYFTSFYILSFIQWCPQCSLLALFVSGPPPHILSLAKAADSHPLLKRFHAALPLALLQYTLLRTPAASLFHTSSLLFPKWAK